MRSLKYLPRPLLRFSYSGPIFLWTRQRLGPLPRFIRSGERPRNPPQVIMKFGAQNTIEKQYPRPFLSEIIRIPLDGVNLLSEITEIMSNAAQS